MSGKRGLTLKTRTWVILIAALALVLAVLSWLTLRQKSSGRVAELVRDGVVLQSIELDRVTEAYQFTVDCPDGGYNIVEVRPGGIRVLEADCPDRVCVAQGWLTDQAIPIVCLPHRLVICLAGEGELDALVR